MKARSPEDARKRIKSILDQADRFDNEAAEAREWAAKQRQDGYPEELVRMSLSRAENLEKAAAEYRSEYERMKSELPD